MSKRKTQEHLSGYLDGEANDAARIEAILRVSGDTATELAAMKRVSERLRAMAAPEVLPSFAEAVVAQIEAECVQELTAARVSRQIKSLPEPDVHPAFARRVVAAIESEHAERPAPWRVRIPGSMWAAAAAAVIVAIAAYNKGPVSAPSQVQTAAQPAEAEAPTVLDEAELLAQFESRVASDRDLQRIVLARFETAAEPVDLYSDRLLTALSIAGGQTTGDAFSHGADYRPVLRRMDRDQTSAVKLLLEASVKEAHEG